MAVQFEKNAFAPGEAVQIQMQIDNSACQVNIDKVVLKLMRRVVLQGGGRSISDVDTIARNQVPGIAAGGKDVRAIALQLPPQTHPSTEGSGLVRCEYWLDVELSLPWAPDVEYAPLRRGSADSACLGFISRCRCLHLCRRTMGPSNCRATGSRKTTQ